MDFDEVKRRLQRFAVMDRDKDGYITAEDLAHYLNVPSDACLHAVFSALNTVSNVRFGEGQGEEREGRREGMCLVYPCYLSPRQGVAS